MKIKKRYEVTLTNSEVIHVTSHMNYYDIDKLFHALDDLWSSIDFEEWTLEISPYWEEVPDNA